MTWNPKTRWKRKYSRRFNIKLQTPTLRNERRIIYDYTIKIANHLTPNNIGGITTCPDGIFKKLNLSGGWSIIYKFEDSTVHFVNFYSELE